jgi:ParB family chromosome partitioning protein
MKEAVVRMNEGGQAMGDKKARQALGRGLGALLDRGGPAAMPAQGRAVLQIGIEELHPDRGQPRQRIDAESLKALAASIREHGVLQPILARGDADGYSIVAGERRWRAAQIAGLTRVPVVVHEMTDRNAFEVALVENLQREDLTPLEEAEAYRRLADEYGLTQDHIAQRVGKDRATVANALRLLRLPAPVKTSLTNGEISMGHARALLGLDDESAMTSLARRAAERGLSVREVERLVRVAREGAPATTPGRAPTGNKRPTPASLKDLTDRLQRALGLRVRIRDRSGKGTVEIAYATYGELDRVLDVIASRR